jgi:tape measure domain-containing protein
MSTSAVRYVVYIDGGAQSTAVLQALENKALQTDKAMAGLNGTAGGLGSTIKNLAFGAGLRSAFGAAKDWIQDAADLETAMKRIQFSSDNFEEGAKNIAFISAEVDKFRIPLQMAMDDYGKFLAMLAGSGVAGDEVRKLHDEILTIAKIKGLDAGQLSAGVMNLGKMIEAGAMDARHLRPLEMQLSGIGKFIADEMGTTIHGLAVLRNKGALTNVDPMVLLRAVEKQAASLESHLPEATKTMQSELNDISNAWLRFKTSLVFDNKEQIHELFATLKDGIKYLSDHRDDIMRFAGAVVTLGKAFLVFRAGQIATSAYSAFMLGFTGQSAAVVTAAEAQAIAFNTLAASIERLNYIQATQAGMGTLAAMSAANAAALEGAAGGAAVSAAAAAGAAGVAGAGAGAAAAGSGSAILAALGSLVMPVFLVGAAGGIGESLGLWDDTPFEGVFSLEQWKRVLSGEAGQKAPYFVRERDKWREMHRVAADIDQKDAILSFLRSEGALSKDTDMGWAKSMGWVGQTAPALLKKLTSQGKPTSSSAPGHIAPPNDRILGQRVINYNIRIGEINGIKDNHPVEQMDVKRLGNAVRDEIMTILHDSQIRNGD